MHLNYQLQVDFNLKKASLENRLMTRYFSNIVNQLYY